MALYSNYNMLALPATDTKYQVGDTFVCASDQWHRFRKFHNLKITSIDYCFDKRLWFDFTEWKDNNPINQPKVNHTKQNTTLISKTYL